MLATKPDRGLTPYRRISGKVGQVDDVKTFFRADGECCIMKQ